MIQAALEAQHATGSTSAKPPVPESLEETGLSEAFVTDLLLKMLYLQGARRGTELEAFLCLGFGILDPLLMDLQQRHLVEVRGSEGHGRIGYTFDITGEGRKRAREVMQGNRYCGPAPIPLGEYWEFAETSGFGQVSELGEVNMVLPLEFRDEHGSPTLMFLELTTGTATALVEGTQLAVTGTPLGSDGTVKLVGAATIPSGSLEGKAMEVILNVRVQ